MMKTYRLIFLLRRSFEYKLPLQLFAPDKPNDQSKGKVENVRENIKVLEETFASFGIKVTVERAEIGPSAPSMKRQQGVSGKHRISNLAQMTSLYGQGCPNRATHPW